MNIKNALQIEVHFYFISCSSSKNSFVLKKSIREIIELKNNEIIFYSHKRCRKYLFSWNDDCLEYKKGKNTFRIFYDSSTNELYTKKPGKWFFIPKKIVYRPLAAETASKRIKQWQ